MAFKLPVASFKTTLTARIEATATTIYLDSVLDDAGNAISGVKGFLIDEGETNEETIIGTVSGSTLVSCLRGISPTDGISEVTALKEAHRKNATIKITSHPYLLEIIRALNGTTQFDADNIMAYDAVPAFTPGSNQIPTVKYADDLALNGSPDASEATKGLFEAADSTEMAAGDDAGTTTAPLAVRPSKLAEVIQKGSYLYAVEDGSGADDAYVAALTPAIVAGTAGANYVVKLTVANAGACTLNLGFGAVAIKKWIAGALTDLETNDIAANYTGIFHYDGTYFVLLATSAGQLTQAQITTLIANSAYFTAPYNQPVRRSVTAGEDLTAGESVSVSSSGAVLTNMTGFSSSSSNTDATGASVSNSAAIQATVGVENGASSYAIVTGQYTNNVDILQVTYSVTTGLFTSSTARTISTGDAGSKSTYPWMCSTQLASDKILLAYKFGSATYAIRAKILTPSSWTEGTEVTVASVGSGANNIDCIMPVSATEAVILYTDAVGLKYVRLTISGTTITVSTAGTVLADADLSGVYTAKQFGSSGTWLIVMQTTSTTRASYITAAYSAGVFSSVSAKSEVSSTTIGAGNARTCESESLSSTKIMAVVNHASSGTVKAYLFTLSGSTATVDAGTSALTGIVTTSTKGLSLCKIGAKTFCVSAVKSSTGVQRFQLFKVKNSGASVELLGSVFDSASTGTTNFSGAAIKSSPYQLILAVENKPVSTDYVSFITETMTTNYEQSIGIVETTTTAAGSVPIITSGTSDDVTGLTAGATYYTDVSGTMTSASLGIATGAVRRVGVADSTTSLIVK